jgi:hypothetical protein
MGEDMTDRRDRFECIIDPCDLWMVWDNKRDTPAQSPQVALVGLTKSEASARCRLLNLAISRSRRADRRDRSIEAVRRRPAPVLRPSLPRH